MTHETAPQRERALLQDGWATTSWEMAQERLANPEVPGTHWLATTRSDGGPHLVPVIGFWIDGAMHVVAGEGTQKGRNLAADGRCAIGTSSTTLPSLDIVIEGVAQPLTDEDAVRRVAEFLGSNNWPLEVEGAKVSGPHAPTAGPPPYTIFRIVPTTVFGLPGMFGMNEFEPAELPKPTRWDFAR
jgi:hypothetical protein